MYGFNTAVSGLLSSKKSLYVVNHNISNKQTEGYSKQQALQRATNPYSLPGIGLLGSGTEIYDIQRVRNSYTNFKYWLENAPQNEWKVKEDVLGEVEKLLGEPSDSAFRRCLDDFFASLDELSKNPSDDSFKEPVRKMALSFTKYINETDRKLDNLKKETNFSISSQVRRVNNITQQIASLNKEIYSLEIDGTKANDLRDKRELLVDELSGIVNIRVSESRDCKFRVDINGMSLVDHLHTNKMKYDEQSHKLSWKNGNTVNLKSGKIKGLMDLLDKKGTNGEYRGIPFYTEKLDQFARGFAEKINEVHVKGYGSDGSTGKLFFSANGEKTPSDFKSYDYSKINASNISLSQDILDNVNNIAVSKNQNGIQDNENLLEMIDLREDKTFFEGTVSQGTPDDFIKSMLSNLAVDSQQAQRMNSTQNLVVRNILEKRSSESSVSINEEVTNAIEFQHVYNACARMITTMDEILDVTVNRLGLVGR